jgi:hypothetical protein
MRVFLELTVDSYIAKKGIGIDLKAKLNKKLLGVADELSKSGVPNDDLKPIKSAVSQDSSPFSVDTLHLYIHNRFKQPKSKDLLIDWDNAQNFFEKIWA